MKNTTYYIILFTFKIKQQYITKAKIREEYSIQANSMQGIVKNESIKVSWKGSNRENKVTNASSEYFTNNEKNLPTKRKSQDKI